MTRIAVLAYSGAPSNFDITQNAMLLLVAQPGSIAQGVPYQDIENPTVEAF